MDDLGSGDIFLPILHLDHWVLASFHPNETAIRYYDTKGGVPPPNVTNRLRKILEILGLPVVPMPTCRHRYSTSKRIATIAELMSACWQRD
ncbi:hypothetical protein L596_025968 [Steinernema carpocapsae]|uniref:Ubiquitin-like protease family profile domain-containing protein n=1 Tax=Steinernema carpocapsae TaxID=34508 RepID=A0A4U5M9B6_STECR|nr:hypothetical protein L596_025968 [Steinernema carpocapsae]